MRIRDNLSECGKHSFFIEENGDCFELFLVHRVEIKEYSSRGKILESRLYENRAVAMSAGRQYLKKANGIAFNFDPIKSNF
jgi:hypothetical protein